MTTLGAYGHPAFYQDFVVCEPNAKRAAELVRFGYVTSEEQVVEVVAQARLNEIRWMRLGEVRPI